MAENPTKPPNKKAYLEMDMVGFYFSSYIHLLYVRKEAENSVLGIIGTVSLKYRMHRENQLSESCKCTDFHYLQCKN